MPSVFTPQASRNMILDSASVLWPTDQTAPFAKVAGGYTALTRTILASANPPDATPFAAAKTNGQKWLHIGFSTGSVLIPGDYEVDQWTDSTHAVLKADRRLPLVDVADVRGFVYPVAGSGITGGATVLATQKECSFMFDCQATIVDGIEFTVVGAAAPVLTLYAGDGGTVMYTKAFPNPPILGAVYPVASPNGVGWIGGMAASLGVAGATVTGRLLFRPAARNEIAGLFPIGG